MWSNAPYSCRVKPLRKNGRNKSSLEEMNISSGSEASNHSCINDSVLQAEHGNERLRKGGGKRQNGGGVGVYQCVFFTISPWCLVVWARKTLWQTLHLPPFPPLICSCKKSKDELLSYVWCRHTGDYVLMFLIPVLLFFRLSSRMNTSRLAVIGTGECGPTRSRRNSESPLSNAPDFGPRRVAVLFCWDGHVLRPSQYSCLCLAN